MTEANIRRTLEVDLEKCAAVRTHKVIEGIVGIIPPSLDVTNTILRVQLSDIAVNLIKWQVRTRNKRVRKKTGRQEKPREGKLTRGLFMRAHPPQLDVSAKHGGSLAEGPRTPLTPAKSPKALLTTHQADGNLQGATSEHQSLRKLIFKNNSTTTTPSVPIQAAFFL